MKADWKPYPKIRPPRTGTYLVTHQNGGANLKGCVMLNAVDFEALVRETDEELES